MTKQVTTGLERAQSKLCIMAWFTHIYILLYASDEEEVVVVTEGDATVQHPNSGHQDIASLTNTSAVVTAANTTNDRVEIRRSGKGRRHSKVARQTTVDVDETQTNRRDQASSNTTDRLQNRQVGNLASSALC